MKTAAIFAAAAAAAFAVSAIFPIAKGTCVANAWLLLALAFAAPFLCSLVALLVLVAAMPADAPRLGIRLGEVCRKRDGTERVSIKLRNERDCTANAKAVVPLGFPFPLSSSFLGAHSHTSTLRGCCCCCSCFCFSCACCHSLCI